MTQQDPCPPPVRTIIHTETQVLYLSHPQKKKNTWKLKILVIIIIVMIIITTTRRNFPGEGKPVQIISVFYTNLERRGVWEVEFFRLLKHDKRYIQVHS